MNSISTHFAACILITAFQLGYTQHLPSLQMMRLMLDSPGEEFYRQLEV